MLFNQIISLIMNPSWWCFTIHPLLPNLDLSTEASSPLGLSTVHIITSIGTWNSMPELNCTFLGHFTLWVNTKTFISEKKPLRSPNTCRSRCCTILWSTILRKCLWWRARWKYKQGGCITDEKRNATPHHV